MGFIKAFTGALSGTFADQWKDYYVPRQDVPATAGIFEAVPQGTNADRGQNTKGSENIITNGSKIVVPEGTALITLQDGAITGLIAEANSKAISLCAYVSLVGLSIHLQILVQNHYFLEMEL